MRAARRSAGVSLAAMVHRNRANPPQRLPTRAGYT